MNTIWLEDFLSLAQTGNFTRSADQRYTTQSAFSRRIQALEEWVGAPLVQRGIQPVKLTSAGEAFRPYAEETLRQLDLARSLARAQLQDEMHLVRFSITHSLAFDFFPRWFRSVDQRPASLTTHLVCQSASKCIEALIHGDCHFAMYHVQPEIGTPLDPETFVGCRVADDSLVPVCAPHSGKPLFSIHDPRDASARYLAYSNPSSFRRVISHQLEKRGVLLGTPAFTSEHASILKSMALEGYGFAWLPLIDVVDELRTGSLVRAADESWNIPLQIWIYRKRALLPPLLEHLWTLALETQKSRDTAI